MIEFTRFRRSSRMKAFRHLFPEVVAPWIHFRRLLLRIVWLFTLPVDRLLETLTAAIIRPFRAVRDAATTAWIALAEFAKNIGAFFEHFGTRMRRLRHAASDMYGWIGQIPVWSFSALAGTFGIILTILLFLFHAMPRGGVVASIGPARAEEVKTVPVPQSVPQPLLGTVEEVAEPFDPFARPLGALPRQEPSSPLLVTSFRRLRLPFDWDPTRTFHVVSHTPVTRERSSWSQLAAFSMAEGWTRSQPNRLPPVSAFIPYIERTASTPFHDTLQWDAPIQLTSATYDELPPQRMPILHVEKFVPQQSASGVPLHYQVLVENRGQEPLDNVTVREHVEDIGRVVDVRPPATVVDGELHWGLSRLAPGEQRRLSIELRPGDVSSVVQTSHVEVKTQIASSTLVQAEPAPVVDTVPPVDEPTPEPPENPFAIVADEEPQPVAVPPKSILPPSRPILPFSAPPEPQQPVNDERDDIEPRDDVPFTSTPVTAVPQQQPARLQLRMKSVDSARPGSEVWTVFEVHNTGGADAVGLLLDVDLSPELNHEHGRVLEHRIERVAAGQMYRTRLTTIADRTGTGEVTATLSDGDQLAERARCVCQIREQHPSPSSVTYELPLYEGCCSCGY